MSCPELSGSRALRLVGAAVALTHVASVVSWLWSPADFALRILSDSFAACWPLWESCHALRPFSSGAVYLWLGFLAILALGASAALAWGRVRTGWWLSLLALVVKLSIVVQDYRFQGNFHYMSQLFAAAWLFVPGRRFTLPRLLVVFYFSAGLLKFNTEWLSGQAFIREPWISGRWLMAACAYVVLLELLFVPFLLSRHSRLRWAVLLQLLVFHAFSWHIVGFLYPVTMLLLLAALPLLWSEGHDAVVLEPKKHGLIFLAVVALAQLVPWLIPGDAALSGQGRLFALNMLDAKAECRHFLFLRGENGFVEASDHNLDWGLRIGCDPLLLFRLAEHACRTAPQSMKGFVDLDWGLHSWRSSQPSVGISVDFHNFCALKPSYQSWRAQNWIRAQEAPTRQAFRSNRSAAPQAAAAATPVDFRITGVNASRGLLPVVPPETSSDGRLFVGADTGWIRALARDGSPLWRSWISDTLTGVSQRPLFIDGALIVAGANGRLYALDAASGQLRWALALGDRFLAPPRLHAGTLRVELVLFDGSPASCAIDLKSGNRGDCLPLLGPPPAQEPRGDPTRNLVFEDEGSVLVNRWKKTSRRP
jgi:hypothetical protein